MKLGEVCIKVGTLSSAIAIGIVLGVLVTKNLLSGGTCTRTDGDNTNSRIRRSKRKARVRRSLENTARLVSASTGASLDPVSGSSRRREKRGTRLCPKDVALDSFATTARSTLPYIGARNYQSLLLQSRSSFLKAGRFLLHDECRDLLISLGDARTLVTTAELKILYVSCDWSNAGTKSGLWAEKDYRAARMLLERNEDLSFVYVRRSCIAGDAEEAKRDVQLRHVPLALLRADVILALPGPCDSDKSLLPQHSDLEHFMRNSWARMELSLAAVGQAQVYIGLRVLSIDYERVLSVKSAGLDVPHVAGKAADELRKSMRGLVSKGEETDKSIEAACGNWLEVNKDPLECLEYARCEVATAEQCIDKQQLNNIRTMKSCGTHAKQEAAAVLGDENVSGERALAISLILFTVYCAQPKNRANYTNNFVYGAASADVVYRPIAVVRSPYRERFGTPRQPQVTASVLQGGSLPGEIVFLKGKGYEEALQDLEGFDMIWVISHMHLNKGWKSKVRPPRLPEKRKGLFSTRSPHRPNALALSALRISAVDCTNGIVHVNGLDLLDGTPVLDVKPYIGYCDAFPKAKAGWLDELGSDHEEQADFLSKFSVGAALIHTNRSDVQTD